MIVKAVRLTVLALAGILISFSLPAAAQTPATLADYWSGNAQWDFVRKWTTATVGDKLANTSSRIKVVNGNWYLFQREFSGGQCAVGGANAPWKLGIRVYKSTNQGETWAAAPELSVQPLAGSDFSCEATDGDAVYDAANNKWRILFQCLNDAGIWQGCYAERSGADPMGAFDYTSAARSRAVITQGSLWRQICDTRSDVCFGKNVVDEGTFNIFRQDASGYFWVSFHGFDGKYGYRGIAKTTDFKTWIAGNPAYGVPADATLSARDGANWRESWSGGTIGPGNGSMLEEGGYSYELTEFTDRNLACTDNQRWDQGLFRTSNIAGNQWSQLPQGNPIVYSSLALENGKPRICNLAYGDIFRDTSVTPNVIYLKFGRESGDPQYSGNYLYRLNKSGNILKNGNLWMADATGWQRLPSGAGTPNLSVYRYPDMSPDGTQFLATNCGSFTAPCTPGSSFFQDVDASAYAGRSFRFGGKFATAGGNGGTPSLVVFQLDANFAVLRSDTVALPLPDATYRPFSSAPIQIMANTKTLRYQFYHAANGITYFAANMYLNLE
ncbi:hypothetical protein [Massilia sp. NR 4-1]|uniref:hypothetical protein n=1 Tax=Massilia sp. NR 4-1 TaxID=1678028 RepID=UPI00067B821A|nr:hypothetical protein [Massilia sp. NR 4-1]AKU24164.1 hypothetical protein ACZ75_24630 [Massilia sp. NR 4-1]